MDTSVENLYLDIGAYRVTLTGNLHVKVTCPEKSTCPALTHGTFSSPSFRFELQSNLC